MKFTTLLALALITPLLSVAASGLVKDPKATPTQAQDRLARLLDSRHFPAPGPVSVPGKAGDTLIESLTLVHSMDSLENFSLNKYFYGPDFRKVEEQYYSWDPNAAWEYSWVNRQKTTYVLTGDGKVKADTVRQPSNSGWTYLMNQALAYNAAGQPTEFITEEWDEFEMAWIPQSRMTFEYAGNGDQVKELNESWNFDGPWSNIRQTLTTYDVPARTNIDLVQDWSDSPGSWLDSRRRIFKYAANGNLDSIVEQNWDDSAKAWRNDWKSTYTFVSPDMIKEIVSESWDGAWQKQSLTRYTYQGTRLTQVKDFVWTGTWEDGQTVMHKYGPVVPNSVKKTAERSGSLIRRVPWGNSQLRFDVLLTEGAPIRASILALNGSRMGMPRSHRLVPGSASILWEGKDASGAPAAPGVYFLNIQGTKTQSLRFLLSR